MTPPINKCPAGVQSTFTEESSTSVKGQKTISTSSVTTICKPETQENLTAEKNRVNAEKSGYKASSPSADLGKVTSAPQKEAKKTDEKSPEAKKQELIGKLNEFRASLGLPSIKRLDQPQAKAAGAAK